MGKAKEIFGIELNTRCIDNISKIFDGLYLGDIETSVVPFQDKRFDFVLFGDILEHLIDPDRILLKYKTLLNENGCIIASIPNIKHYSILLNLIFHDKFEYVPEGILDRSHIRFFTKRKIYRMFKNANLQIIKCECNLYSHIGLIDKILDKLKSKYQFGMSFFTIQYIVVARNYPRI